MYKEIKPAQSTTTFSSMPWFWKYDPIVLPLWDDLNAPFYQTIGSTKKFFPRNGTIKTCDIGTCFDSGTSPSRWLTYGGGGQWDGSRELTLLWYGSFDAVADGSNTEMISCCDSFSVSRRVFQFRRSATGYLQAIGFSGNNTFISEYTDKTISAGKHTCAMRIGRGTISVFLDGAGPFGVTSIGNLDTDAATWTVGAINTVISGEDIRNLLPGKHYFHARMDSYVEDNEIIEWMNDPFAPIRQPFDIGFLSSIDVIPPGLLKQLLYHHRVQQGFE